MSLRGRLSRFVHEVGQIRRLAAENDFRTCLSVAIDRLLHRRRTRLLRICGTELELRSVSPDVEVALHSLGKEFGSLSLAFPREARGVIIDAGGYIGTAAIAMSRMFPAATIISLEPSSENFALLCRNVRGFPNVRPVRAALVPAGGPELISLGDRGTGEWGFTIVPTAKDRPVRPMEAVEGLPIDRLLRSCDGAPILLMKLDIEGAEARILESIGALLDEIPILVIELHERIVPGCDAIFAKRCSDRLILRLDGEKYVAVSERYFRQRDLAVAAAMPA